MNKVFEVIEAKTFLILNIKISILTHPRSYVHAIIKFKNGLTKFLIHDPDMKIPIFNSINDQTGQKFKNKPLDFSTLNNFNLKKVDETKFPLVRLLNKLPNYSSLYETVLITINDYLVYRFLEKKSILNNLKIDLKFSNSKNSKI